MIDEQLIRYMATALNAAAKGNVEIKSRCECLSSWIMDRRRSARAQSRTRKWHRALFSATRKRGKNDPLSPPKIRIRSSTVQPKASPLDYNALLNRYLAFS